MWIKWNEGLLNLDFAINISISEMGYEQYALVVEAMNDEFYMRYFESEKDAAIELEKIKLYLQEKRSFPSLMP